MTSSFLPRLAAGLFGLAVLLAAPASVSARNAAPTPDAASLARQLTDAGVATSYAQGRGFGRRGGRRGGFGRGGRRGGFAGGGYRRGGFGRGGVGRRGFYGRGGYGRRGYGRGFRRGGIGAGAAVGGLAAGALIGGAIASQARPGPGGGAVASCQQRFRSYDPASGTYLGHDGRRHPCP